VIFFYGRLCHANYAAMKKRVRFFVNPTDKLDELKAKFDGYFIHIGSNQRKKTCSSECVKHWLRGG